MNQYPQKELNRLNYDTIGRVLWKGYQVEGKNFMFVGAVPMYLNVLVYATLVGS